MIKLKSFFIVTNPLSKFTLKFHIYLLSRSSNLKYYSNKYYNFNMDSFFIEYI